MRVLLDATAVPADLGGVGRYVDGLVAGLRGQVDLHVTCAPAAAERFAALGAEVHPVALPDVPRRLLWEQTGLERVARAVGATVLHCPHYTQPVVAGRPVVVTLHDATFFTHPELHSAAKGRFFRTWTRVSLRRAARCVVVSRATRDELVRVAGADLRRLDVAHLGVDTDVFHPAPAGTDGPYVAFLGTLEPRKNVPALVRGWVRACEGREDPPRLVLAGGAGWDTGVDEAVAAVPPHLVVERPGYLPLADLAGFLGGAVVVAYPSLGEGFGLPVLEAMACGATVLTTRHLSLPEVGGDAVAYTGTAAADDAAALTALLDDDHERGRLAARALERAATFTWDACAQAHVRTWEQAARS